MTGPVPCCHASNARRMICGGLGFGECVMHSVVVRWLLPQALAVPLAVRLTVIGRPPIRALSRNWELLRGDLNPMITGNAT